MRVNFHRSQRSQSSCVCIQTPGGTSTTSRILPSRTTRARQRFPTSTTLVYKNLGRTFRRHLALATSGLSTATSKSRSRAPTSFVLNPLTAHSSTLTISWSK
eukprot:03239_4